MAATATATVVEVEQLWALGCLLANQQRIPESIACLEVCCRAESASTSIALMANVLLAETCLTLCETETKKANRELWWKRYKRADRCIHAVEAAVASHSPPLEPTWGARQHKCRYLLAKLGKGDPAVRGRQQLERLCDGMHACGAGQAVDGFKEFFVHEIRSVLTQMHAEAILIKSNQGHCAQAVFESNLKLVRTAIPQLLEPEMQLWLVEVSCHVLVMSMRFSSPVDVVNALKFADRWIAGLQNSMPELRLYHLLIKGFYSLRLGEIKQLRQLIDSIKAIRASGELAASTLAHEPFISSIIAGLEVEVACRFDPNQAMTLAMTAIHEVQVSLQQYSSRPEVYAFLVGALFDMLYILCNLNCQQARYYEMGVNIDQLLKLFGGFRQHVESTVLYPIFQAQVHILVAKYANAIGMYRDAEGHLRHVMDRLLPPLQGSAASYPHTYLRLWVDVLDAGLLCGSIASPGFSIRAEDTNGVRLVQIHPTPSQLKFLIPVLESDALRTFVESSGNADVRSKYDLALCKWIWATQELGLASPAGRTRGFRYAGALDSYRSQMVKILHESLELVSNHVNCTEATAEIMALFGPKLIELSRPEDGEETLKNAVRLSLHAKNLLLQARLLVDIFRLYSTRQLAQAQATTAEKYEKKVTQLQRRIAQAQAETATRSRILRWSSMDSSNTS